MTTMITSSSSYPTEFHHAGPYDAGLECIDQRLDDLGAGARVKITMITVTTISHIAIHEVFEW
jgi:hypothetical protein